MAGKPPKRNHAGKFSNEGRAEAEVEALELRKQGLSYRQIGKKLGIGEGTAYKYVQAVLDRTRAVADEKAHELRQVELERLDIAIDGLMPAVKEGDPRSCEVMGKLMERRAKLLGLDAPAKQHHEVEMNLAGLLAVAESEEEASEAEAPVDDGPGSVREGSSRD